MDLNYEEVVGITAAICTIAKLLSGTLVCLDIYKQGTTEGKDPFPFIGGIVLNFIMLALAVMFENIIMVKAFLCGILINIFYVTFFYFYTPKKRKLVKTLVVSIAITFGLLAYSLLEDQDEIEIRWKILVTLISFLLTVAPLYTIKEIVRTKKTDILPFPMILMGTLAAFHWFLYGIILKDRFMILENFLGLAIQIFQLSLIFKYPSNADTKLQEYKKEKLNELNSTQPKNETKKITNYKSKYQKTKKLSK